MPITCSKAFHGSHCPWLKALAPLWDPVSASYLNYLYLCHLNSLYLCPFNWRRDIHVVPPSNLQESIMLYETGYTIGLAASLTCLLFPRGTLLICSSFNVSGMVLPQGFSLGTGCSLSLDGSSPGISQLTPSPPSSLCPEVILSDSPHIHPALNHNPSFHSPSHTQNILLCFIRSISFITTYCT